MRCCDNCSHTYCIIYPFFFLLYTLLLSACNSLPVADDDVTGSLHSVIQQERAWAGLETRHIDIDSINISYNQGGPEDAEAIILLHGLTGDKDHWNRIARYLTGHFRVYIPDLPGHGDSFELRSQRYTPATLTRILKQFADRLGLQRYHLVGHSLGGALAIQWAIFRPTQVQTLTLISSAGLYRNNPASCMQEMREYGPDLLLVKQAGDMQRVVRLLMRMPPFLPLGLWRQLEKQQIQRYNVYREVWDTLLNVQASLSPDVFEAGLRTIKAPTLLLWGEQDCLFDVSLTEVLEAHLPAAETVILPAVGHVPILEAPEISAHTYLKFLSTYK